MYLVNSNIINRSFGNSLELQYKSSSMFFSVYAEMRTFIVTCLLYSCLTTNSILLGKLAIRDLNNWVIQELLLADLAKTQYTRDDEGPYSCVNYDQHRE